MKRFLAVGLVCAAMLSSVGCTPEEERLAELEKTVTDSLNLITALQEDASTLRVRVDEMLNQYDPTVAEQTQTAVLRLSERVATNEEELAAIKQELAVLQTEKIASLEEQLKGALNLVNQLQDTNTKLVDEVANLQDAVSASSQLALSDEVKKLSEMLTALKERVDELQDVQPATEVVSVPTPEPAEVTYGSVEAQYVGQYTPIQTKTFFDEEGSLHSWVLQRNDTDSVVNITTCLARYLTTTDILLCEHYYGLGAWIRVYPGDYFLGIDCFDVEEADKRTVSMTGKAEFAWRGHSEEVKSRPKMAIYSLSFSEGYNDSTIKIRGKIINYSSADIYQEAEFQIVFYDEQGEIVGCAPGYGSISAIRAALVPGATREWTDYAIATPGLTPGQLAKMRFTVAGDMIYDPRFEQQ